ncbi:energy transducer TonB [Wohlfahrtiimonas chitiniclastica]|uniref:energy transducer TonB n=1 Tax=Wohlfahrtiimonas chitiniclastica TaxID=400946 RepID=UPI001BCA981C|nr:energy transducer TonB [Wohlfahrtiimonas chitiniclastica]MBS7817645.1 energy transducer TonB [Wohlfahrtiimonas chitiniclastica]MBS7823517.1 energy transducer TonB [Wohlfahrtiimonas chitiniclastica]MBS7831331.1 energy transducer TonB [Wohlfahrtiimonas chitiniclastica]MBS7833298.1 energy transducer TonB [Wohlfahrtiimonas chitiniclastica]
MIERSIVWIAPIVVIGLHAAIAALFFQHENHQLQQDHSTMAQAIHSSEPQTSSTQTNAERYIIMTIDSDWFFPKAIEPEAPPIIAPPKIGKPAPQNSPSTPSPKSYSKPSTHKKSNATSNPIKTPSHGSGQSSQDGPAGFINGNSHASIDRNINRCYPLTSRRRGEQGRVIVRIFVNEKGALVNKKVVQSSGFSRLDRCALDAITDLKVKPAIKGGKAISSHFDQPIEFRLR